MQIHKSFAGRVAGVRALARLEPMNLRLRKANKIAKGLLGKPRGKEFGDDGLHLHAQYV